MLLLCHLFFCPSDLESTLSALESVHKFESLLREIYDTDNWWCEQAVVIGEITDLLQAWHASHSNIMVIFIYLYYVNIMFSVIHFYRRSKISPLIMRFLLATFPKKWYVWKRECRNNVKQSNTHEENLDLIYWRRDVIFFPRLARAGWC